MSICFLFSKRNVARWFWAVCAHRVTRICSRMAMWHCRFPICYPPMFKVRKRLDKPDFCRECYVLFSEIPIVRACQWKITLLIAPRFLELTRKSVSLTSGSRMKKISYQIKKKKRKKSSFRENPPSYGTNTVLTQCTVCYALWIALPTQFQYEFLCESVFFCPS